MALRFLAVAVAVVCISGCNCGGSNKTDGGTGGGSGGDGGNQGDAGPPALAIDQFCEAAGLGYRNSTKVETRVCGLPILDSDWAHIEYNTPFIGATPFPSLWAGSDCSVDGGMRRQMARYIAAANGGRLAYDGTKALACQQAGRADGGFNASDVSGNLKPPCSQAWTPKVALNGACEASYECTSGNFCKPSGPGTCAGTCQPLKGENAFCTDRELCKPEFSCDTTNADGGAGVCTAKLSLNDACDSQGGPECKPGLMCLGETGAEQCLAIAKLNESCTRVVDVGSNCGEGTCVANFNADGGVTSGTGLCKLQAAIGQACGDGTNGKPPCDSCGTCNPDGGHCAAWGQAGFECAQDSDCFDPRFYFCDVGTQKCTFKPRSGQTCNRFDDGQGNVDPRGTCLFFDDYCSVTGGLDLGNPGACKNLPKLTETCGHGSDKSEKCAAGYCKVTDGGASGTCADQPLTGETCSTTKFGYDDCQLGTDFCDKRRDAGAPTTSIGLCHTRAAAGQPCGTGITCQRSLICPPATDGGVRTCSALAALGAACAADSDCASDYCPKPTDGTARVCADTKADGTACKADGECTSGSCDPLGKVCVSVCTEVLSNETSGCMSYDLHSMTSYLTFSVLLGLMVFPRRRRQA